jgi:FKBP-type peptidyl-prolyl cis-trans isomerase
MKKNLLILLSLPLILFSCKKTTECPYNESAKTASASEISAIQTYLTTNSLTATQHSSGIFFNVTSLGTGGGAGLCSNVTVKYTGRLFNGTIFDSNSTGVQFELGTLIIGWQKGIPLVGKGGIIRLYVPPSLAYGASAVGSIPANSYLIFDIEVVNIS